jgi:hypothetical protein
MVLKYLIEAYFLRLQGPSELGVEFAEQAVSAPNPAIRHDPGNLPTEFGHVGVGISNQLPRIYGAALYVTN